MKRIVTLLFVFLLLLSWVGRSSEYELSGDINSYLNLVEKGEEGLDREVYAINIACERGSKFINGDFRIVKGLLENYISDQENILSYSTCESREILTPIGFYQKLLYFSQAVKSSKNPIMLISFSGHGGDFRCEDEGQVPLSEYGIEVGEKHIFVSEIMDAIKDIYYPYADCIVLFNTCGSQNPIESAENKSLNRKSCLKFVKAGIEDTYRANGSFLDSTYVKSQRYYSKKFITFISFLGTKSYPIGDPSCSFFGKILQGYDAMKLKFTGKRLYSMVDSILQQVPRNYDAKLDTPDMDPQLPEFIKLYIYGGINTENKDFEEYYNRILPVTYQLLK